MLSKLFNFIKIDIWNIQSKHLSGKKSFYLRLLRVVLLATRGFGEDQLKLRASALTFYTLLAIVPILAMAFAIAKGFGFESLLENRLLQEFPGHEAAMQQVLNFAHNLLEKTQGGMMAGIGVIVLFWASINVLNHIEQTLNDIWDIKKSRSIWRKFSDYLSIMVLSPALIILSSSVSVYINMQVTTIVAQISFLGFFSPLIFFCLKLLPFVIIWILFSLIYLLMPNTKVKLAPGLIAGFIAGGFFQILQFIYFNFQFIIAKYNAIYGSFAALPLFLFWLQLSWLIVLFGAEISYAYQNMDTYEFDQESRRISFGLKKMLALMISHLIIQRFVGVEKPLTMTQIAGRLEIPIRLVHRIVADLTDGGILSEVEGVEPEETAYQPAVDTGILNMSYIVDALEKHGFHKIPVLQTKEAAAISASLERFKDTIEQSPDNLLLRDLT
ncbi:MAG: YihY/virulence factor BrkB family protein [Deltaproteobacteria bacterium]|nr:MAG: YihY/virulence factor BrkB family protein [Deltaproteobacteria bacterium]